MPTSQPGFLKNLDVLSPYLTEEQIEFLRPHQSQDGWGLRSEWLTKHLAMNAAQQGAIILTKTRITSITMDGERYVVVVQGGGPSPRSTLIFDHIIDASMYVPGAPGNLKHHLEGASNLIVPEFGAPTAWFGGTALTTDCQNIPNNIWNFERAEGLCEVWFDGEPTWTPKHGWIEQVNSNLPTDQKHRTIDGQFAQGVRTAKVFE